MFGNQVCCDCCVLIGPRHNCPISPLTVNSQNLTVKSEINYLGITFCAGKKLKACIRKQCEKFYRACNAIFAKCGKFTSEVVVLHLLRTNVYLF